MSTTLQKIKELAEIKICLSDFVFDSAHKVAVNVRLCSFADYEKCCDELSAHPAEFLASQFLDPNTGEKLFSARDVKHLTKSMVMRLARLWIDVQLNRIKEEE